MEAGKSCDTCVPAFVEQAVFAFAGGNMKLVFTYHIVKFVSVNAGGIDDDLRLKGFGVSVSVWMVSNV